MADVAAQKDFPEVIYGDRAMLMIGRERLAIYPEPVAVKRQVKHIDAPARGDLSAVHRENFFSCMRSRRTPVLGPELGCRMMVAIRLGVDSYREGRVKHWDPQGEREHSGPKLSGYEDDGQNPGQKLRGG